MFARYNFGRAATILILPYDFYKLIDTTSLVTSEGEFYLAY